MKKEKSTQSDINPIVLTKEQYLTLVKTVYLGNWMANAHRTGRENDPHLEEYEEISDLIFSYAQNFGFPKDLENEIELADGEEKTETHRLHEEYDNDIFWEELSDRLGVRDFFRKYSPDERKKMSQKEHFIKMQECVIAWEVELEKYGLERLEIKEK